MRRTWLLSIPVALLLGQLGCGGSPCVTIPLLAHSGVEIPAGSIYSLDVALDPAPEKEMVVDVTNSQPQYIQIDSATLTFPKHEARQRLTITALAPSSGQPVQLSFALQDQKCASPQTWSVIVTPNS